MFTKEEAETTECDATIVNWRLSDLSTMIAGLSFVSWPEFPDSNDHLLAGDGLHTCHEGTYIVVKKFRRVCREFVPSFSSIYLLVTETINF